MNVSYSDGEARGVHIAKQNYRACPGLSLPTPGSTMHPMRKQGLEDTRSPRRAATLYRAGVDAMIGSKGVSPEDSRTDQGPLAATHVATRFQAV